MAKLIKPSDPKNEKKKLSKGDEALDALIFLDTNVLLDFYRNRKNDVKMQLLDEILAHKEIIISSFQVEMEFKKNRQSALGEAYGEFLKNKSISQVFPLMLSDDEEVEKIKRAKEELISSQKSLEEKFKKLFIDPYNEDEVFKKIEELFRHKSPYILTQDKAGEIIKKAKLRFELGFPPRKDKDNSIGDAVNWEWILECAKASGKSVILISRDGDYGYDFDSIPRLNDYLMHEFSLKTSKASKIQLTNRFVNAFKMVKIPVTSEMIKEEEEVLKQRHWSDYLANQRLQNAVNTLQSALSNNLENRSWTDIYSQAYVPKFNFSSELLEATKRAMIQPTSFQALHDAAKKGSIGSQKSQTKYNKDNSD